VKGVPTFQVCSPMIALPRIFTLAVVSVDIRYALMWSNLLLNGALFEHRYF